jgi:hypothetical protein
MFPICLECGRRPLPRRVRIVMPESVVSVTEGVNNRSNSTNVSILGIMKVLRFPLNDNPTSLPIREPTPSSSACWTEGRALFSDAFHGMPWES